MLAAIGATHATGASAKNVAFHLVSTYYHQVVKLAFGDADTATNITDSAPLPSCLRAYMAETLPAEGTAGQFAPALSDRHGRLVVLDEALPDDITFYAANITAASITLASDPGAGWRHKIKSGRIYNRDAARCVNLTFPGSVIFRLPPKSSLNLAGFVGTAATAFGITVSSSAAPLEVSAVLVKERA